ncbi:hypothetical protein CKA32_001756 [Geitlerinema sp. FC II]|nr:hypothetical protein CKA32_001756 [Geitlerinema sp. FC II]
MQARDRRQSLVNLTEAYEGKTELFLRIQVLRRSQFCN